MRLSRTDLLFKEFCGMTMTPCDLGDGCIFYQDDRFQKLGTDTLALSRFAPVRKNTLVCDLGAGQGALSLLLLRREPSIRLWAVELQPAAAAAARNTFAQHGFSEAAVVYEGDLRAFRPGEAGRFSLVVANPPYFEGGGVPSPSDRRRTERQEEKGFLSDLCACARRLLKTGGDFSLVYRPERLTDLLVCLRASGLEPKLLRFVTKDGASPPSLVLVTAKKGARPGLRFLSPLYPNQKEGSLL